MVVSPETIAEEDDMHVCELPNSIPDTSAPLSANTVELPVDQTNEYPFELLSGEVPIEHGNDLTDGCIYLTNYRLFIYSNQSTSHCSFINCPIRLIESIEIKDNTYLCIQCKDIRSFRLVFFSSDKSYYWSKKLNDIITITISIEDLFAMKYFSAKLNQENQIQRDYFHHEITRLQLDKNPWRTTEINWDYKLSPSYPNICVVPASISDEDVHEVAKFRSHRRFPTIVWRLENLSYVID
jgi:myotubularin-related protein 3/4